MPEYTYIDTRLLWLLMLLATGALQYLLIGDVKLVIRWTRERNAAPVGTDKVIILPNRKIS